MPQSRTMPRSERRGNARADANLTMSLRGVAGMDGQPEIETESENISASGVYCFSPHYLAPLSKVGLTLVLPRSAMVEDQAQLLKCDAVVVRCEPQSRSARHRKYELACSFVGLDEENRRLLDEFVTLRNLKALGAASPVARKRAATRAKRAVAKATVRKAAKAAKARTAKPARTVARARANGAAGRAGTTTGRRVVARPGAPKRATRRVATPRGRSR